MDREIRWAARAVANRDFRARRQAALDAEVDAMFAEGADVRWREIVAQSPVVPKKPAEEVAIANVARARNWIAALEEDEYAQHVAQTQAILGASHARAMLRANNGVEDPDNVVASMPGVALSPKSPPRGAVGGVSPEALIGYQGHKDRSAFSLHWQRLAMEEASYLRQQAQGQRDAWLLAHRDSGRAQVKAAEAAMLARDRQREHAEDAAVIMRDAWLVKAPPFHFERQLTRQVVDHGEEWRKARYGETA